MTSLVSTNYFNSNVKTIDSREVAEMVGKVLYPHVKAYIDTYAVRMRHYLVDKVGIKYVIETINNIFSKTIDVINEQGSDSAHKILNALNIIEQFMTPVEREATNYIITYSRQSFVRAMIDDYEEKSKEHLKEKSVYVFLFNDGKVKIGISRKPKARAKQLEKQSGLYIKKMWWSQYLDEKVALNVERKCHKFFNQYRLNGEYFHIRFNNAISVVKRELNYAETD